MEKQASELYTRKLFTRFQEELVGTLTFMASKVEDDRNSTIYQVSKFGENHKVYNVKFDVLKMKATCSCQMFEFSGLLCRHVLAVFRVTNILTLPSCYILRRWTRNAKSSVILEEHDCNLFSSYLESHMVRCDTLRHAAFKFVDEGAETVESYNVAIEALQEAVKIVSLVTKNEKRICKTNGCIRKEISSDRSLENHNMGEQPSSSSQFSEQDNLDKKIQELTEELESANRKCETYRANLLSVLRDVDDQRRQLSVKVQNVKLGMKDSF